MYLINKSAVHIQVNNSIQFNRLRGPTQMRGIEYLKYPLQIEIYSCSIC